MHNYYDHDVAMLTLFKTKKRYLNTIKKIKNEIKLLRSGKLYETNMRVLTVRVQTGFKESVGQIVKLLFGVKANIKNFDKYGKVLSNVAGENMNFFQVSILRALVPLQIKLQPAPMSFTRLALLTAFGPIFSPIKQRSTTMSFSRLVLLMTLGEASLALSKPGLRHKVQYKGTYTKFLFEAQQFKCFKNLDSYLSSFKSRGFIRNMLVNQNVEIKSKLNYAVQCSNSGYTVSGWTFITPFSSKVRFTGFGSQDLAVIGVILSGVSTTISTVNLLITRRTLSAIGMKNKKSIMPFLALSLFLTMRMLMLIIPVLGAAMIMLQLDRH